MPRPIGAAGLAPLLPRGQQLAQPRLDHLRRRRLPGRGQDLGDAEEPDGDRHHAEAVAELDDAVGEAEVAAHLIDANHAQQQAERRHGQRLQHRARAHVGEHEQAEQQQRQVLRRTEAQGEVGQRRGQEHQAHHAGGAGDVGADRGDGQRRPAPPLARHGVAVDAGHHRGGLAGNAHEDRGRRAAVHGAVVDAGQHHDGARGVQAEGRGQQQADPRQRPHAGQHADQRADQAADERVHQNRRRQRDREAEAEVGERLQHQSPNGPRGSCTRSSVSNR